MEFVLYNSSRCGLSHKELIKIYLQTQKLYKSRQHKLHVSVITEYFQALKDISNS
jgi:hypothetical protein